MKSILGGLTLLMLSSAAFAQMPAPPSPQPPPSSFVLPSELVKRVYDFLGTGGTHAEAAGLRDALEEAVKAPQREADIRRRIEAALAEAKKAPAQPSQPPQTPNQ